MIYWRSSSVIHKNLGRNIKSYNIWNVIGQNVCLFKDRIAPLQRLDEISITIHACASGIAFAPKASGA